MTEKTSPQPRFVPASVGRPMRSYTVTTKQSGNIRATYVSSVGIDGNSVLKINIHRDIGTYPLNPLTLAEELRREGFVAFVSSRLIQRRIDKLVCALATNDLQLISGEVRSPNYCMCIVDTSRYDFNEVGSQAALADFADENVGPY